MNSAIAGFPDFLGSGLAGLCRAVIALRRLRQRTLSRQLGLSEAQLSRYLSGHLPIPSEVASGLQRELCLSDDAVRCALAAELTGQDDVCPDGAETSMDAGRVRP
jgi:hypothetical protein